LVEEFSGEKKYPVVSNKDFNESKTMPVPMSKFHQNFFLIFLLEVVVWPHLTLSMGANGVTWEGHRALYFFCALLCVSRDGKKTLVSRKKT